MCVPDSTPVTNCCIKLDNSGIVRVSDVNASTSVCDFKMVSLPAALAILIIRGHDVDLFNSGINDCTACNVPK